MLEFRGNFNRGRSLANIKSAIKRNKTNEKARLRNRIAKSVVKTAIRSLLTSVTAGEVLVADEKLKKVQKLLDTQGRKGLFHKNTVARRKSRFAAVVAKLKKA